MRSSAERRVSRELAGLDAAGAWRHVSTGVRERPASYMMSPVMSAAVWCVLPRARAGV